MWGGTRRSGRACWRSWSESALVRGLSRACMHAWHEACSMRFEACGGSFRFV